MQTTRKCKTTVRREGDERVREQHCVTRTKKLEASESDTDTQPRGKTSKEVKAAAARYALKRAQQRAAPPAPPAAPPPSSDQDEERKRLVANMRRLSKLYRDVEGMEGPEVLKELTSNITNVFRKDIVTLAARVKDPSWAARVKLLRQTAQRDQKTAVTIPIEERTRVVVSQMKGMLERIVLLLQQGIELAYGGGALWG
jgi:hypothetical protein